MSDTNDTQAELAAWELLAEARRERDEWKQLAIQYSTEREHNAMQSLIYKAERDEARGQRDSLAEALQKLADCDWVITPHDRMDAVREIARKALQSLTPNEP